MSEIRATTISDLVGTGPATLTGQHAAKVWSNLNGTGTIAERDSFNISGYVDNGTGDYTFTLTNNMSDVNYITSSLTCSRLVGDVQRNPAVYGSDAAGPLDTTTGHQRILTGDTASGTPTDTPHISMLLHGDLA
jgi:hypothetical protein